MHAYLGRQAFKSPKLNFSNTNGEPFRQIYPLYGNPLIAKVNVHVLLNNIITDPLIIIPVHKVPY